MSTLSRKTKKTRLILAFKKLFRIALFFVFSSVSITMMDNKNVDNPNLSTLINSKLLICFFIFYPARIIIYFAYYFKLFRVYCLVFIFFLLTSSTINTIVPYKAIYIGAINQTVSGVPPRIGVKIWNASPYFKTEIRKAPKVK